MPEWFVVLLVCLGLFAALIAVNVVLVFQAAMAGGGHPSRWYLLFFATYEVARRVFRTSASAYLVFAFLVIFLIVTAGQYGGQAALWIAFSAFVVLISGFFVIGRPR